MAEKTITIGIVKYPHALKSSVYGIEEVFTIANEVCRKSAEAIRFEPHILHESTLPRKAFTVILLPPSSGGDYYLSPTSKLIKWLISQHERGAILGSACTGAFILAGTGVVGTRSLTTHWGLEESFHKLFPSVTLDVNEILINHGDVLTAGGLMSWMDLVLEIVMQFTSSVVVRQLGKHLVVDTGRREQRFYKQFSPSFAHGDQEIVEVQQRINIDLSKPISIAALARDVHLTERTMQRRFLKATGLNPNQYLQKIRIQKVCDLLETTNTSFELIANQVGYEDVSACRKVFIKILGLTPSEFRRRFVSQHSLD